MSVKLWLVRHGQSTWNAQHRIQGIADPPLDEVGLQQIERVAERMQSVKLAGIYSSSLQRARVTAEAIQQYFPELSLQLDDRLREYDFGVISGLTWEEVSLQHPDLAAHWLEDPWSIPVQGSEGQPAFRARVTAVMKEIAASHAGAEVVVVAHGGTFAAYLGAQLGLPIAWRYPFHFGNTSVSVVEVAERSLDIHFLNDMHHLDVG